MTNMKKADFLKISGHKDLKSFYSEFPTEEAFMAKHGKKIKKANVGLTMSNMALQENIQSAIQDNGGQSIYQPQGGGMPGFSVAQKLGEGTVQLLEEIKQAKNAKRDHRAAEVAAQVAMQKPVIDAPRQKQLLPINTGEAFFPIYGTGTEPLAKNGKKIKKAANGFNMLSNTGVQVLGGENAGTNLGSGVGEAVSYIPGVGPVLKQIAEPVGKLVGTGLDQWIGPAGKIRKETKGMKKDLMKAIGAYGANSLQNQNVSYMRTGGNIRQNEHFPSDKYAMGGELQLYDGTAQSISNNPYSGQVVKFNGDSHKNGGMDITYGNNPVEVEGGETAHEQDGSLIISGNLRPHKTLAEMIDKDLIGKSFKGYSKSLAQKEQRATNIIKKSGEKAQKLDMNNYFDKLTANSYKLNLEGNNLKLQGYAEKRKNAADLQQAMLDVADEKGKNPEKLAANGKTLNKAVVADAINSLLPYVRPMYDDELDMTQISPEMFALANNQLEPVQSAPLFHPQLKTPYNVSFQDSMNENQADYNTSLRLIQRNPAAASILNAQKYSANQKIKGEEFRTNQAMMDKVYGENINALNQAQMVNNSLLNDLYMKQEVAKDKTKATTLAALSSIADKYTKKKAENLMANVYSNLYPNYTFDNKGRAINMGWFEPNIPQVGNVPTQEAKKEKRNGALVKAIKSL